jgi:hypothetical protein
VSHLVQERVERGALIEGHVETSDFGGEHLPRPALSTEGRPSSPSRRTVRSPRCRPAVANRTDGLPPVRFDSADTSSLTHDPAQIHDLDDRVAGWFPGSGGYNNDGALSSGPMFSPSLVSCQAVPLRKCV